MKRSQKRLSLTKETVSHLQSFGSNGLAFVAGGGTKACASQFTDCQTEPTSNLGTCGTCYACTNPT